MLTLTNKRYYIQHSNKLILKLTYNCLKYPYCQTSIHTTDRHIFTIQNTKESYTPFLLCFHSYHLFSPTKHLTINNLRRRLKMTAIKIRLGFHSNSIYNICKITHKCTSLFSYCLKVHLRNKVVYLPLKNNIFKHK